MGRFSENESDPLDTSPSGLQPQVCPLVAISIGSDMFLQTGLLGHVCHIIVQTQAIQLVKDDTPSSALVRSLLSADKLFETNESLVCKF